MKVIAAAVAIAIVAAADVMTVRAMAVVSAVGERRIVSGAAIAAVVAEIVAGIAAAAAAETEIAAAIAEILGASVEIAAAAAEIAEAADRRVGARGATHTSGAGVCGAALKATVTVAAVALATNTEVTVVAAGVAAVTQQKKPQCAGGATIGQPGLWSKSAAAQMRPRAANRATRSACEVGVVKGHLNSSVTPNSRQQRLLPLRVCLWEEAKTSTSLLRRYSEPSSSCNS
jgi:hypothetical protein